ncbi:MAG: acyl-CoA dehydrogenase [Acidimicrobiia bacterium]|nr:acyl-CoA dehydrogenase [Acidimicrobiia bacterium]MDJ0664277.1 acyl-CoA dehydrogenase [Acidimicrobiia bacterium]
MSHYKTNLRDIKFNLFEAYNTQNYMGEEPFTDMDEETARHMLDEIGRFAVEEFAASFEDADRNPPVFEDGEIKLPQSLKDSLNAYFEAGWDSLFRPQELDGVAAPSSLRWAVQEILVGANPSAFLFIGTLMAVVLNEVGTPEQIERFVRPALDNNWGGTMVLTEPDAGSDVGAGTTKAIPVDEDAGVYHLEGVKRFITSGDHDAFENIIHLVLARPVGAGPGTKGLSMFIVPKFLVNEDGSIGERNGVVATNLEKKMGIKASTTTELTFGMDDPCVGYLVGNSHDGIRQMFQVIERARMLIGTKAVATLSTGYLNSLEYAKERVQGADLTQMLDKTAPRVEIIRHPDVRRMLMLQKSHVEGLRALLYYTAWVQDQKERFPDDDMWAKRDDLLLPLVKGYSSEKAYELLSTSLQVYGGSGFTTDYPIEQYIRDTKIDTLYEGTTAIQALDLFFRKIARDQGQALMALAGEMLETVKGGPEELAVERELLGKALEATQEHVGAMVGHLMGAAQDPGGMYKLALHANALLESASEVTIGWLLLRHAEVALDALPEAEARDKAFYEGKIASARFFARHALPKAKTRQLEATREDGALMEMADEAF